MDTTISKLKELGMIEDMNGQLYLSLPKESYICGSSIYENVACANITCDRIGSNGVIVLALNYPSRYTGRWERTTVICVTDEQIMSALRMLGRPMADLEDVFYK